jgi:hypothetical protein
MNMGEKTVVTKSCELLLDVFQFVSTVSVVVIKFQTTEAYSSFDLINVQYNM